MGPKNKMSFSKCMDKQTGVQPRNELKYISVKRNELSCQDMGKP